MADWPIKRFMLGNTSTWWTTSVKEMAAALQWLLVFNIHCMAIYKYRCHRHRACQKCILLKCKWAHRCESNWKTVLLNFSQTPRCRPKPASVLSSWNKSRLPSCLELCPVSPRQAVSFSHYSSPRRNKQLIRQNQGLWLVINAFFQRLFLISVCPH